LIFPFLFAVEELYNTRYQSGSFSLINVGSGFHCLRTFFFSFSFMSFGFTARAYGLAAPSAKLSWATLIALLADLVWYVFVGVRLGCVAGSLSAAAVH
jgi:hypothetical protein